MTRQGLHKRYFVKRQPRFRRCYLLIGLMVAAAVSGGLPATAWSQKRVHSVFFEGTDHELNVYRIHGKKKGKTLMLIGGIQGDEPGGFLSADHYADISLARGNLIVVPRANFQSIVLKKRQINEDMNRKFAEDRRATYETKIVDILKKLIRESNALLNLHDGSGFYSPLWKSELRNPKRYGQSIIADSDTYVNPKSGETLKLGEMGRKVALMINRDIDNPDHHFHFNNHRTKEEGSLHKEQRKSATYYALFTCGIPAFGVETSKSLNLEEKVRQHNLAINAFMELLGIVQETPGLNLKAPKLNYLVISINDALPVVVKNEQTLHVSPGDFIRVSHIEANYERGLSADIKGVGNINDIRKNIRITHPTRIVVRKDYYPCGRVYLTLDRNLARATHGVRISDQPPKAPLLTHFKVKVNGQARMVANNEALKLVTGDALELIDVVVDIGNSEDIIVNFKGYVGDRQNNTGEDRGYTIHTGRDLWKRYSVDRKGRRYKVIASYDGEDIGKMLVDLQNANP